MASKEFAQALIFESEFPTEGRTINTISVAMRATDPVVVAALQKDPGQFGSDWGLKTAAVSLYFILIRHKMPKEEDVVRTVDQCINVLTAKRASELITGPVSPQWEVPVYVVTWPSTDRLS